MSADCPGVTEALGEAWGPGPHVWEQDGPMHVYCIGCDAAGRIVPEADDQ